MTKAELLEAFKEALEIGHYDIENGELRVYDTGCGCCCGKMNVSPATEKLLRGMVEGEGGQDQQVP